MSRVYNIYFLQFLIMSPEISNGNKEKERFFPIFGPDKQEQGRVRVLADFYSGTEDDLMKHRVVYLEGTWGEETIKQMPDLNGFCTIQPGHNGYTGEETQVIFPPPTGRARPYIVIPVTDPNSTDST